MSAWKDGLLDNDASQDFIGSFVLEIEDDIIAIHEADSRKIAGCLSAAVGILLRLSSNSFDPTNSVFADKPHFYPRLICSLSHNLKHFVDFPGNAPQLLGSVLCGGGEELAARPTKLDKRIDCCLFGGQRSLVHGSFSELELDLFAHPSSQTYMKSKTKELVKEIESLLKDRNEVINMSRCCLGGMFGLLLVLPCKGLKLNKIESWRKRCQTIWNSDGADDEANDIEFEIRFRNYVDKAFDCAANIYQEHNPSM